MVAALIPIAEKLRSIIVADGPNTNDEEAIKWRKSVGNSRVYVVDPWVKVFTEGKEETLPSSPFVVCLIAKVDSEWLWLCRKNRRNTLPKLTIKTEEYRAGGMDIPINIDMGMEKLEADFTFAEYDSELFRLFGLIDGNSVSLTLRGGLQGSGSNDIEGVIINLRGIFKEFDFVSWKPAEKATLKCTVAAHYYRLTIGGNELIEIDAENMIRKINGVDQMALLQTILGI
ncbi:tail tube protein [Trichonephila inaurata madagascariensis]|uniref:Tail tube protein n=1 Tax=Trichonephila inaurata madagascariensis TaxID=2747483 RepID=A0A8X6WS87_9ARAC|nr:tail tube protein [Trichonephila inaurata madagascariensis]